ncbi:aminomethyl-transferring glycine dehydrogenase subunit GcvPA [Legionella jordanis]|uniref:Probable glycine dehydrogenase (decarboxylating) subunit 1 n=1 Tax=Legionella jordanis TaxID=456 RepID=A0A0W0VCY9_9GAMM|nr:aminomethyl-transferring glycine dehydrogenase subunit GcvPA [Legionella jordanis]KTD17741.1 glycine dehydrogenase subunit 1 [Legionella jordanis]RMX01604.1 aminomethyl-transferring glycine dehydrogenase subunit GcvPA [Legionella jordanis]RMX21600.1 aminomethyl-transferring glycine dehydrogenase subunit GcvPA [Legionella jordanis]VEH11325.1 glycine dehydrogenase subunit 1 [Legionella jordanis]
MPYIPHSKADTEAMLESIGVEKIEQLFDEIPQSLLYGELKNIPEGLSEMAMLKEAQKLAHKNQSGICFLGAGSYEHHIPAAVWDIASRGEFLTAYTPYQAEASQGTLQLLYEFQTMIAELTGLDVANASMYDGASALAEAVLMAVRLNKKSKSNRVLVTGTLHPLYRETLETIVRTQHIEVTTLPFDLEAGISSMTELAKFNNDDITALVIPQPNFFGCLELVDELSNWAYAHGAISIACVNPTSLALLNPPGEWGEHGVDIACGEGQPLGAPIASGGPYFGFLSTRLQYVRQMPGRLIGQTVDKEGKPGFSLTLQAREQHIRRGKATSNICTNQGLLVTAATIYMSLLGAEGLFEVARQCHLNTQKLKTMLLAIKGVEAVFTAPSFHEMVLKLSQPADEVLLKLRQYGIIGGYALESHFPQLKNCILICATEMRTPDEMQHYVDSLKQILHVGEHE